MNDVDGLECRVCRCGPEDERPLYQPCLCSGSIALVHQDCLETWLQHSNKDKCELCSTKYVFTPEYAADAPEMSYGEFVGLFWAGDGLRNPVNQQRNPAPVQRQYQQREVLPLPVIPRPVVRPHLNLQPIREDDQIEIGQIDSDSTMPLMELSSRLTIESDASVDGNETYVHTPKVREMRRTSSGFNNWPKSSLDSCDFRQAGAAFNESMVISPQVYMHGRNSISSSNSIKAEIAGVVDLPDDESQYFKEMTSGLSNSNSGNSFENINSDTKIENELSVDYISDSFSSDDSSEDSNSSYDIDDDYSELSEEDWDDDEMNLPDNNNNNNNNNGGDLRFALDELFGLRGPLPMTIFKHKSADEIIMNLAKNLVGSLTLSWTVGITYMLIITLSVLQLREILHPDILSSHIRPQESHVELLQSLVSEKSLVHFRRLVLPLEVAIGHFTTLSILEQKKNYIGRVLYLWLIYICRRLKMTRFILPCPMKRDTSINNRSNNNLVNNDSNGGSSNEPPVLVDGNGVPYVDRPLRRPPPGWDARFHENRTRWAWGNEEPSALELNVAPRSS
eukprot:gene19222-25073_t